MILDKTSLQIDPGFSKLFMYKTNSNMVQSNPDFIPVTQ